MNVKVVDKEPDCFTFSLEETDFRLEVFDFLGEESDEIFVILSLLL